MTITPLLSFVVTLATLLIIIWLSRKYHWFIDPQESNRPQHFHTLPTPRAGGLGIMAGILFLLSVPMGLKLTIPLILAFLSGIFEDYHRTLSPRIRLAMQLVSALSAIWLIDSVVTYLGLGINMPYWLGVIFSAFAIVGMMNAVNIIDGFNGLASGLVLLILLSFGITAYQTHNSDILQIIFIIFASVLAFFLLNFPKGKIFLGDGGAYLLGFIVSIIGIFLAAKYESVSPWYVLAVFIYPVWEVVFSIYRKVNSGNSPFAPDSYHLHMLIYRHITHHNALTTIFIILASTPFIMLSTLFANQSITNIAIAGCFVLCYLFLYNYLYQKEHTVKP